jgi:hypothetical protein
VYKNLFPDIPAFLRHSMRLKDFFLQQRREFVSKLERNYKRFVKGAVQGDVKWVGIAHLSPSKVAALTSLGRGGAGMVIPPSRSQEPVRVAALAPTASANPPDTSQIPTPIIGTKKASTEYITQNDDHHEPNAGALTANPVRRVTSEGDKIWFRFPMPG